MKSMGWEWKELGQIGEIVPGLTYSPKDVDSKGLLVLRSSNVQQGRIDLRDCVYVKLQVSEERIARENDILICVRNGSKDLIGKSALIPSGCPIATHGAFMMVFRSPINTYLYHLFQTKLYKEYVARNLGATINSINGSAFRRFKFPVPPERELKKITEVLSSWDQAIELTKRLERQCLRLHRGLIRTFFLEDSLLGEKKLQKNRLDSLATVERGKFSARPRNDSRFYGGNIPFVQTGDVTSSRSYLRKYSQTLNDEGLKVSRVFPKGTILVTIAANIGESAITNFPVACPDSLVGIVPNIDTNGVWLNYAIQHAKTELDRKATKGAQKNINLETLRPLLIRTPSRDYQDRVAILLSNLDRKIDLLVEQKGLIEKQKQGLMQRIFTSEGLS